MARIPTLTRDKAPQQFLEAFDHETADSGGVIEGGPGSVMINSPEMRKRANHLVFYFRQVSTIPQRLQELAMCLTARHMDCQYIWYAHSARGRKEGLSDALVDALRDKQPLPPMPDDEQTLVDYATEMFENHRVSQPVFQKALDTFGAQHLTELTTMMGYYTLLAFNANSFEIDVPAGGPEKLLPI